MMITLKLKTKLWILFTVKLIKGYLKYNLIIYRENPHIKMTWGFLKFLFS